MPEFAKFLTDNKDAIDALIKILEFGVVPLSALFGLGWWLLRRASLRRVRVPVKALDVITDANTLLPKLYGDENNPSLLADHNIPYFQRDPNSDVQGELRQIFQTKGRYLLITAPTGLGKTREAATLAASLMSESWRVMRIKSGWLDVPQEFPSELGENRSRLLFIIDDLNGLFGKGGLDQTPNAEKMPLLGQASYHDRLLKVLDYFEQVCTDREIRVIATARNEADQWKLLKYDPDDELWKRFERFELAPPRESVVVDMIKESAARAQLPTEREDLPAIARENDGTFKNVVLNLRRLQNEKKRLTLENYTPSLKGSWSEVYESATAAHPAVRYIYDAIDLLRQVGISLYPFIVESAASLICGGNWLERILRQREIRRALHYLVSDEKVLGLSDDRLAPYDGQVEAKGTRIDWIPYAGALEKLMLNLVPHQPAIMVGSLLGLGNTFYEANQLELFLVLMKKGIEYVPKDERHLFLSNLGVALDDLHRAPEAEASYRKAIELNPSFANAYFNLGVLLAKDAARAVEAEASYRKAIELNPSDALAYSNLGNLMAEDAARGGEAEASYRKAIELNPSYAKAYNNLGLLLAKDAARAVEAEASYRKAIESNPRYVLVYNNLGLFLADLHRAPEAEASYRKAIELNPSDADAYFNLGALLDDLHRAPEAEASYRKAIELNPRFANAYFNLGNLMAKDVARRAEAEASYRKAIELNPSYGLAYNNLGTLMAKDVARRAEAEASYRKAIELNPSDALAYSNLGNLMAEDAARRAEAEASLRKAIELNPSYAKAYNNLGLLLAKDAARAVEAEASYRKAIESNPNDAVAYNNLGALLSKDAARRAEAEASYRKAIELNPNDAVAYNNLGALLSKDAARRAEAEASYRKAIELNPRYVLAHNNLGILLGDLHSGAEASH